MRWNGRREDTVEITRDELDLAIGLAMVANPDEWTGEAKALILKLKAAHEAGKSLIVRTTYA